MSYIVLARKYRPRRFTEMVGQEHVVQALGNALTRQRLHHAYLFTGTRGVGKTTVSRILAKSLNCTGPDGQGGITAEPCGVCDACRDIDAGRHVDYVELDAASNRGVDEISQLLDQAVYKPVAGRFKVYMIDEVHMLSTTAFNAMLKTLEEPPEYLKFVLATTDPQKVPVTVLSRCLQFNLRPMAPETVQRHLGTVLHAEGIEAEAGALRQLSRAARGSMRDALSLTDQAIAFGGGALQEAAVRQMLGSVDRSHVVRIVQALGAADGAGLVRAVDELRGLGLSAAGTLEDLAALAQQMALAQAVPAALDPTDPETATVRALAPLLDPDETQLLYSIALHGRAELALAPDEYGGLMMVLLRLLAFRPQGAAPRRVELPAAEVTPAPAVPVAVPVAAPAPEPVVPVQDVPRVSRELRRPLEARARMPVEPQAMPPAAPAPAARAAVPPWEDEPPGWDEIPPADENAPAAGLPQDEPVRPVAVPVATPAPLRPRPVQMDEVLDDPLVTRWCDLFQRLSERALVNGLVRELAWQAQCIAIEPGAGSLRCVLRVERESLRQSGHRDRLQAAITELVGQPVTLEITPGAVTDSPSRRETQRRERAQHEAEGAITDDPMVQELLARYPGARIVPGSIRPN
ncbi:DNA polymerase III subunits gamma and tau [Sphaerotilus natans subsp. natans DSM 6575]|uniref:DNA polymerase III subunit gamma/tau n=1 Tax=Sphaerotilus natans subsp. natans DSM 6575 TaxID=1286631 RepID=A0A059KQU5_9BURK|nr:DNA polymerase III subunit gamma/tau [Sphaerotilus natans]KDB53574.1 DNA polymerase III subunits gamma and tau [Sphaerotilus natans subsp. natans DSM 6575]SIR99292.1 DNA polymerase-3 subunit gamma/tau [Sphaerotilus natans]